MLERAPEPVELIDGDCVARAQPTQQLVELGAAGAGAGDLLLIDELAARLGQGIELQFQVLVAGRDAGVANVHGVKVQAYRGDKQLLCTLIAEQVLCTKSAGFAPWLPRASGTDELYRQTFVSLYTLPLTAR